ncbi:MAG: FAD-binding oxidoreductase [Terriglobia bacterium]
MTAGIESVQAAFAPVLGAARVVIDPAVCASLSVDGITPQCILYPTSAEEVAAALRCAAEHDLAVIPCRNGTKLGVGNPPRRYDVALSLKDMNRVWHYEPSDLTITAEPGMKFGDFQHFVARQGLWLPADPRGGARATLGGIVATNSTGPLRLAHGAPRDMVLGMKIATTEGKVVKTGGRVVKNVAGYDIAKLMIGSYGTLGVIVEISLKLFPLPAHRATFVLTAGRLGIARDIRRRILGSPLTPMRALLLDAGAAKLVRRSPPPPLDEYEPEIWLEFGGSLRVLERCAKELEALAQAAGARLSVMPSEEAEEVWARLTDFRTWLREQFPRLAILKATLPDSASEEFISRAEQEAESEKARSACFCQAGVGIAHVCLLAAEFDPQFLALIGRLRKAAHEFGGALVVEGAPLEVKKQLDVWGPVGDDFATMKKMKALWDPDGILSPGRSVGGL